jgi:hypothetical protein
MTQRYPESWESWHELNGAEQRNAVADTQFWSRLSEQQRQRFLDEAGWQDLRLVAEAKRAKLDSLVTLDEICQRLGLTSVQVYWLMSTRKLDGAFLVGGTWKYDPKKVDRWVERLGGVEAVRNDVEAQIERHRAARDAPSQGARGST